MMLITEFFSEPFWCQLGLALAHFVWQGVIVTILVSMVVALFRVERGNSRYAAYLLAFAAMLACPIVTFIVVKVPAKPAIEPVAMMESNPIELTTEKVSPTDDISPDEQGAIQSVPEKKAPVDLASIRRTISDYIHISIPSALAGWSIGVLVLSIRLLLGIIGVYRWRRNLEPLPNTLAQRVGWLCKRLEMADFPHVFISPYAIQAMAIGYLRPMILLPAALVMEMPPEMLEAVIAHELAHIRRFDLWVNLLQRVTETLLFFHPAVWWLSHRMQAERELCCDTLAVKATGDPLIYAAALGIASQAGSTPRPPVLAAGFCDDKKPTLSRVRHVLGLKPAPSKVRFWLAGIVTITFMLALAVPFVLSRQTSIDKTTITSTLKGLPATSDRSDPNTKLEDRFEVRFETAKYASLTSAVDSTGGTREQAKERLRLNCEVRILDPNLVLGISRRGAITQFDNGSSENFDVVDHTSPRTTNAYIAPRYRRRFVEQPKPPKRKTAIRSSPRLLPLRISRPQPVFELDESHVVLELDSGLPGPDFENIDHVNGHFYVLMAESLEYVEIPFEPSKKWVRLTPDLEVRVLEAQCHESQYNYRIESRKGNRAFSRGPLRSGSDLPSRFVANRQLLGDDGKLIRHSVPTFLTTSAGGRTSGRRSGADSIKKIRFVIAVNPSHHKIPFELENIPLPRPVLPSAQEPVAPATRTGKTARRGPFPVDKTILRKKWVNLSWKPGSGACSYDIYLGDSFEDVNNGADDTFLGNRVPTFLVVGLPGFAYREGLFPGTTYYWRVDEISEADPNNPRKGDVRSFSIAPRTAHDPIPADGAEFVDLDAELSWTEGFGAKLHRIYFGDDLKTVANETGGLPQSVRAFIPPALTSGTTYYWRVDEFDVVTWHKGNVWSFRVKDRAE